MDGIINGSLALENDNTGDGIPFIDFSTQGSNAEFSIEAWIQAPPLQDANGAGVVAKGYGGGGEQFALDTGTTSPSSYRFFVRTGAGTAVDDPSSFNLDGNWHHVVGVCDQADGALYVYVDGALQNTVAFPTGAGVLSIPSGSFPVSIGSRALSSVDTGYYDQTTNAVMNDVAIYDYALSSNQVAAHYAGGAVAGVGQLGHPIRAQQQHCRRLVVNTPDRIRPATKFLAGIDQLGDRDQHRHDGEQPE